MKKSLVLIVLGLLAGNTFVFSANAQTVGPATDLRPSGSKGTPVNITLPSNWGQPSGTPVDFSRPVQGAPVNTSTSTYSGGSSTSTYTTNTSSGTANGQN